MAGRTLRVLVVDDNEMCPAQYLPDSPFRG